MIPRLLLALCCCFLTVGLQAQTPKPRIERAADLPRFTYKIDGKLDELLRSADRFSALSAQIRRDDQSVLDGYDIADQATQRALLNTLAMIDYLDGRYDDALAHVDAARRLEEKPAEKLYSGMRLRAMAQAAKVSGPTGPAFAQGVHDRLSEALEGFPYDVVANGIRQSKSGAETIGETVILGGTLNVLQPIVDKSGELTRDLVGDLVRARFSLVAVLPLKQTLISTYSTYLAAHTTVKPDIWAARDVTLSESQVRKPVVIAVWDGGVDTALYEPRVVHAKGSEPAYIAYDGESRPVRTGALRPLPPDVQANLPMWLGREKGFSDLRSNIDSPEASELKQTLSNLPPDQYKPSIETLNLVGGFAHGTHVAGIALAGNPGARLVVGRMTYGHTLLPDPCDTPELIERANTAARAYVAFFKREHARVVNMSWGGTLSGEEGGLEACGIGKTVDERKALARKYFYSNRDALAKAFASAPEILFVAAAGNSDSDASFDEAMPSSIVAPNLITVGAVDQAGDEASFTSYGPTVKVHADGYQVVSKLPGGADVAMSGTSMASPEIANLAGKILAVNPLLKPAQVIEIIVGTAERTPDGRRVLANPKAAVAQAEAGYKH